jgi:hypothetical protein
VASELVGDNPVVTEETESAAEERRAAEEQAFADKLAKRPPPNPVERAEIEKARKRTKARAPSIVMHVEDRGTAGSVWKGSRVVASAGPRGYCGARGRERDLRLNQSCRSWSGSESRTLRPAVIEAIIRNESSAGGAASAK